MTTTMTTTMTTMTTTSTKTSTTTAARNGFNDDNFFDGTKILEKIDGADGIDFVQKLPKSDPSS